MICINCCRETDCLYVEYSNNHIRLTDCTDCHDVVDQYVEIDNVLLFIDLLLLKPGAYRHLVYNSLELELSKFPDEAAFESAPKHEGMATSVQESNNGKIGRVRRIGRWGRRLRNWFVKFDKLNRIWVIITAFEVYLTWVSEERKFQENGSDALVASMLSQGALGQYMCFAVYCAIDFMVLHNTTYCLLVALFNWGSKIKYAKYVVSYTVLLSYGAKIYPILMLIWPYDTLLTTGILKIVANLYVVEALKIVTNQSYAAIISLFSLVFLIRSLTVKPLVSLVVTKGDVMLSWQYARAEYHQVWHKLINPLFSS
ncbi:LADA_0C00892g1_1 [Lachancea dasiensis]|uniref:Protein ARV n=1 Tax=Lachancea dasiensis TaxID=1072105 RepID=A0A1G4IXF4_9SACH|nr:LADA_0C00892g1_1 [Lachancea dasiensis]